MVRRLFGSLVVLASLLGILQPSIACAAACTSAPDCCPAGSPAGGSSQLNQPSLSAQPGICCEARPVLATLATAIGTRSDQGHACGSSAAIATPTLVPVGRPPQELRTATAQIPDRLDDSLTYLRTARLRL